MSRVCVGILLYEQPERLAPMLAALQTGTTVTHDLLILLDGPDEATRATLEGFPDLRVSVTAEPLGAAACFNRLARESDAEAIVLLEGGAIVGPGWLERLLAALDADARNGLAGPSTNLSWNEQGVFPHSGGSIDHVARTAQEAALRFGTEARTLEPLYSLADFCYLVRRDVIDAIGGADERYSLGPCWEMDYNIRAARAGWRGVWAGAAYVHRAPTTRRRRFEEDRRFQASKHLYQDKFCGARLRGVTSDYRSHCRGAACPNFAPPDLIAIRRPLISPAPQTASAATSHASSGGAPLVVNTSSPSAPLVSCIMPTCNRRSFVPQAIRCFLRQDYPQLELVVVDDGSDAVADCIPDHSRIRYIRLDRRLTIGAKRNLACEHARGEIVVHWDDDDWYPPWRVRTQARALLDRPADICGTSRLFYYDALGDRSWEYVYGVTGSSWVAGNTLAYRKTAWRDHHFPDLSIGEDTLFVSSHAPHLIGDLMEPALCVAMVHAGNTSHKETGGAFWHARPSAAIRALLGDDRYFYGTTRTAAPAVGWPLVSCIMPTYNRRSFVKLACQYFASQNYPNKELVIVDDGDDQVGDLTRDVAGVRYVHQPTRMSIGAKRNLACHHARGEIIAHWDDDDWYAPDRLRYQVAPIVSGEADMTGLENACVLDLPLGDFWTTEPRLHEQMFVGNVHGGTLVYSKQILAQGLRYPETNLAEDAWLLRNAVNSGRRLMRLSNPGVFIYVRHSSNAWSEFAPGRFLDPIGWKRIPAPPGIHAGMLSMYRNLTARRTAGG